MTLNYIDPNSGQTNPSLYAVSFPPLQPSLAKAVRAKCISKLKCLSVRAVLVCHCSSKFNVVFRGEIEEMQHPCSWLFSKQLRSWGALWWCHLQGAELKNIRGSRWNPVVCFRSAPLKLPSSPPVPARWKLCHVSVHPGAASSNCTAVIPSGAVKFHQCAAGGKLGWGNYLAQSASSVLSDLMGKKFVQLRAQLRSNRIFRLFKPSFGFWPCRCSIAI